MRPLPSSSVTVLLPRGEESVPVSLRPLPIGFDRRLAERGIVPPVPPRRPVRDSRGEVLRDGRGLAVLREDEADAEYRAELARYRQRVAVLMVAESLDGDAELVSPRPDRDSAKGWVAYADAAAAEMEGAGVTAGDLVRLCRGVSEASGLLDEQLAAETDRFFSGRATDGPPPGGSPSRAA